MAAPSKSMHQIRQILDFKLRGYPIKKIARQSEKTRFLPCHGGWRSRWIKGKNRVAPAKKVDGKKLATWSGQR